MSFVKFNTDNVIPYKYKEDVYINQLLDYINNT